MLNLFRGSGKKGASGVFLWIVMIAAVIGLGGYELVSVASGLSSQNVATVGDQTVSRSDFARSMRLSTGEFSQRLGRNLTMEEARTLGVDDMVVGQLVTQAALDQQTETLSLSAGDEELRNELVKRREFRGPSGEFDKLSYDLALENSGLRASVFEDRLRADLARTLLEAGISGGVDMPDIMARTLLGHAGEERSYAIALVPANRVTELPEPTEAELQTFYDENKETYRTVETRKITIVAMQPTVMIETMDIPEDELRAEYEANLATYDQPERRIVDRIVFPDMEMAKAAKARIEGEEATFTEIGAERDLSPAELEMGSLRREDISGASGEAIFAAADPGLIGPVKTDLGAALYRLNAILGAHTVPFEDAQEELRQLMAGRRVGEVISSNIEPARNELAGGTPLEEIAADTDMVLTTLEVVETGGEGLVADQSVRQQAFGQEVGEDPILFDLQDNGIAALRVDEVIASELPPLEDVTDAVRADWEDVTRQRLMREEAERIAALVTEDKTLAAVLQDEGIELTIGEAPLRRRDQRGDMPPTSTDELFDMEAGETRVLEDITGTFLLNLTEVTPYDPEAEDNKAEFNAIQGRIANDAARDMFFGFTQGVQNEAGVSINETLIDQTLSQMR
ncbi:peptidylprolyl isomerase [Halovulum sp. GXIMD14793]